LPPDFLGIGAQKAGTTWLHQQIAGHPGIWMPQEKELHYFDEKINLERHAWRDRFRGDAPADQRWRRQARRQIRAWRRDRGSRSVPWNLRYFLRQPSDDWYRSLFSPGEGKVTGEITPNYTTLTRRQVGRVHYLLPDARIVLMMRNPIDRAWSASVMKTRKMSKEEARRRYEETFTSKWSRLNTDYERTLRNWTAHYPPESIFVGFLEDVSREPRRLLRRLYRFLDVAAPGRMEGVDQVIHGGVASTMPSWVGARLAEIYGDLIDDLAERFGGYASFWQFCAVRLRSGEITDEEIPYPFWQTPWWDEWAATHGEPDRKAQSGPLAEVQTGAPQRRTEPDDEDGGTLTD